MTWNRRKWSVAWHRGADTLSVLPPVAIMCVVAGVDVGAGPQVGLLPLLSLGPAIAPVSLGPARTGLMGLVALGFTPQRTAEAVVNGIDHGLAAADVINVLARLTSLDSASFGLVSGAGIAGLTDGHITATQAMDVLLGLSGVSADNMMLLLAGFAGAGTASDQLAAGRAIAYLPAFDPQLLEEQVVIGRARHAAT